jgi:hypothetical protein
MRGVTLGFAALRATAVAALALLLWNPSAVRVGARDTARLVLLDASLSMTGHGGRWREALDTARGLGFGARGSGGVIWRFGERVTGFDTLPPADGASRLGPALVAAAARGGELIVVTDGAIADGADLPPDLVRRARIIVLPRGEFVDAFVASVDGPRRVAAGDTIRLKVSYGVAGRRDAGCARRDARCGIRDATLAVNLEGRRLISRGVVLPDSGVVSTELTLPASRIPHPGWTVLDVRLEGVGDEESRDDGRFFVFEVSPQPSVVLIAAPPDWETRFLARTLQDVARVPVRTFVQTETGRARWRDATTLEERTRDVVARAVTGARLVIEAGNPAAFAPFAPKGAVLVWPDTRRLDGDWYVQAGGPSPLAAALAGVAWDSLPPLTSVADLPAFTDSGTIAGLTARLARRGAQRPVVLLSERTGPRRAAIAGSGLYRWAFRGGASGEAYRALVAGLVDWLLEKGAGSGERFVPLTYEVPNGMPLVWRWAATGAPRNVVLTLAAGSRQRVDTLRFDATGRAELRLPPGMYRYAATGDGGGEQGLVAVETYSDEWRPAPATLAAQPGALGDLRARVPVRDRWWLFALAVAAFVAEWAWRRRQGLP